MSNLLRKTIQDVAQAQGTYHEKERVETIRAPYKIHKRLRDLLIWNTVVIVNLKLSLTILYNAIVRIQRCHQILWKPLQSSPLQGMIIIANSKPL